VGLPIWVFWRYVNGLRFVKKKKIMKSKNLSMFWAILLTSAGVLFLFRNFGLFDFRLPSNLISWRLIPLIIGINSFFRGETVKGIIGTSIAVVFYTPDFLSPAQLQVYKNLWPLLLIVGGGLIYYNHFYADKTPADTDTGEVATYDRLTESYVMGGSNTKINSKDFKGGQINCIMGGAQIDLVEADLQKNTVIDLFVLMGGIELHLPKEWNVKLDVFPLMGGIEDQISKFPTAVVDETKRITIKGNVIMGGVEIKRF
jgi:predicted membrane protein